MVISKKKSLNEIKEAMILAAGRGKRMRYKTKYIAKPLIKLQKKSLLEFNLKKLSEAGVRKCVVNTSYLHLGIKNFIKTYGYRNKKPKVIISNESKRLETGGGVKKAIPRFEQDTILVINGDSIIVNQKKSCPIENLYKNFSNNIDILLLLVPRKKSVGYIGKGDFVRCNKTILAKIRRKLPYEFSDLVFTGWQLLNKEIFKNIDEEFFSLNMLYNQAQKKNRLYAIIYNGTFLHVSDSKSLLLAENYLRSNNIKLL